MDPCPARPASSASAPAAPTGPEVANATVYGVAGQALSGSIAASPESITIPWGQYTGSTLISWSSNASTTYVMASCYGQSPYNFATAGAGNFSLTAGGFTDGTYCTFELRAGSPTGDLFDSVTVTARERRLWRRRAQEEVSLRSLGPEEGDRPAGLFPFFVSVLSGDRGKAAKHRRVHPIAEDPHATYSRAAAAARPRPDLLQARLELWEHERTIALMGFACQGAGVLALLVFAGLTGGYLLSMGPLSHEPRDVAITSSVFVLLCGSFLSWLGAGLRRFEPNRRIAAIAFGCLELLAFPVGTVHGYRHLKLLLSPEGKRVLSREHQARIRATPQIRTFQEIIGGEADPDRRDRRQSHFAAGAGASVAEKVKLTSDPPPSRNPPAAASTARFEPTRWSCHLLGPRS